MRISKMAMAVPLTVVLAGAGCATSGRYVALKEFSASQPAEENSPLKGRAVCIKAFASSFSVDEKPPDEKTVEPPNYTYVKPTKEEASLWDEEVRQRKNTMSKSDWPQIGYVRNGYGWVMGKVYALDDPGLWLADALKADLQKLGARVVDSSQETDADISVCGNIRYCKAENNPPIMGGMQSRLVVDAEFKPKAKTATTRHFHTKAVWGGVLWGTIYPRINNSTS